MLKVLKTVVVVDLGQLELSNLKYMKNILKEFLFALFFSVILSIIYGTQTIQGVKSVIIALALITLCMPLFFIKIKHYIKLPTLLLSKIIAQGSGFFLVARFFDISNDKYDYIMLIMFFITSAFLIESCNNSIKNIQK